jgi:uncharacterized protein (TIGR02246 family)
MSRATLLTLLPLAVLVGCEAAAPTVDLEAEGQALMQLSRDWSDLVATGDLEAIFDFWAEDAVMLPPDMPALEGREAIRAFVEAASQVPGFGISWEPISVHVSSGGDMAYMIERNVSTANDSIGNTITTHGKVVTVWRKDATGAWKNVADIWNAGPPPGN